MSKTQNTDKFEFEELSLETQAKSFAEIFGVYSEFTDGFLNIEAGCDDSKKLDEIVLDSGYIVNPACVIGFFFDMEKSEVVAKDVINETTETPVGIYPHGHFGSAAITFKSEDGVSSTLSKTYVDDAEKFLGIDINENPEYVKVHNFNDNHPVVIEDPYSSRFVAIAPRRMSDKI